MKYELSVVLHLVLTYLFNLIPDTVKCVNSIKSLFKLILGNLKIVSEGRV